MGKKGTKRRTRWKALPLSGEDAGSGNEDELQDDEQSTTSSGRIVLRMGERSYRSSRRYPYDRDRSKEPLVKLESKTFDQEEYTKITTPRQDVLFKKGYFTKRKNESSSEENNSNLNEEVEGEEGPMEQLIITNGFVDERGHYLVNGTSYEIYDPYTNTVTVMVGPPPYTSGVTPPVLAAVSCQPVPLQPVDWYPPGPGDWPAGPAWTPAYPPPTPKAPDTGSSEGDSTTGSEEPVFVPPPPFIFPTGIPIFPIPFAPNGIVDGEENQESDTETPLASTRSATNSPLPQQELEDRPNGLSEEPLQTETSQPRPQLNPAGPEFVPRYPLRPNGLEFVPNQPLKANGIIYTPRHVPEFLVPPFQMNGIVSAPQQTINPSPQHRLSPTELHPQEKVPISNPQVSHNVQEIISQIEDASEKTDQVQPKDVPPIDTGQNGDLDSKVQNHSSNTVEIIQTQNLQPQKSSTTQTVSEVSRQKPVYEQKLPNTHASPRHSNKKPPQSPVISKQTTVIQVKTDTNSRQSYARTVINGLDQEEFAQTDRILSKALTNGTSLHEKKENHTEKELNGTKEPSKAASHTVHAVPDKKLENPKETVINRGFEGKESKERFINRKGNLERKVSRNNTLNGALRTPNTQKRPDKVERITNGNNYSEALLDDDDSDSFTPVENKRSNRVSQNGHTKNEVKPKTVHKEQIAEKQCDANDGFNSRKDKGKQPTNNKDFNFGNSGSVITVSQRKGNTDTIEKIPDAKGFTIIDEAKDIVVPEKIESDKSSTISELSSPTELSSGQTTPPGKISDIKQEEKRASELNKSMEKLKENLEVENDVRKMKKSKKTKKKTVKETKKPNATEVIEDVPLPAFLQLPQDDLSQFDVLLGDAATNAILRSLRVNEPSIAKVNLFPPRPTAFPCDLYTKTNLSNMRATKPEEFFASIVENPVPVEPLKVAEKPRKPSKAMERLESVRDSPVVMMKQMSTAYKPSKKRDLKKDATAEVHKTENKSAEQRLGIVDAVKTWLESQEEAELVVVDPEDDEPATDSKNELRNPLHASSPEKGGQVDNECNRVADDAPVDDSTHINKKLFDSIGILTGSPKETPALELAALVDARTSVDKYYSLSPRGDSSRQSVTSDSAHQSVTSETSEQDAFDALEYPFPRPASADVVDPGAFPTKELACKLQ